LNDTKVQKESKPDLLSTNTSMIHKHAIQGKLLKNCTTFFSFLIKLKLFTNFRIDL